MSMIQSMVAGGILTEQGAGLRLLNLTDRKGGGKGTTKTSNDAKANRDHN